MSAHFHDRVEAGRLLAGRLGKYAGQPDVMVIGLPRGGVPVAAQVAWELNAPLDILVVRKLGSPGNAELAMGAIATGGVRVINDEIIRSLHIPEEAIAATELREQRELERREHAYRGERASLDVDGRTVILVDDGIATGATLLAAVAALRKSGVARIIAAAPVIASGSLAAVGQVADETVAVIVPENFHGVGECYEDFSQTTDAEVREILAEADRRFRERLR
jgi:predicted phosphoribosyltransferase